MVDAAADGVAAWFVGPPRAAEMVGNLKFGMWIAIPVVALVAERFGLLLRDIMSPVVDAERSWHSFECCHSLLLPRRL